MTPFQWFMVVLPGVILIVSAVQRDWRPAVLSAAVMAVAVLFIRAHFAKSRSESDSRCNVGSIAMLRRNRQDLWIGFVR